MADRFTSWADVEAALVGYHGLDEPTEEQAAAWDMVRAGVMSDGRTWGEYLATVTPIPPDPMRPDDIHKIRARLEALRAERDGERREGDNDV